MTAWQDDSAHPPPRGRGEGTRLRARMIKWRLTRESRDLCEVALHRPNLKEGTPMAQTSVASSTWTFVVIDVAKQVNDVLMVS